jgi:hypothetical protein
MDRLSPAARRGPVLRAHRIRVSLSYRRQGGILYRACRCDSIYSITVPAAGSRRARTAFRALSRRVGRTARGTGRCVKALTPGDRGSSLSDDVGGKKTSGRMRGPDRRNRRRAWAVWGDGSCRKHSQRISPRRGQAPAVANLLFAFALSAVGHRHRLRSLAKNPRCDPPKRWRKRALRTRGLSPFWRCPRRLAARACVGERPTAAPRKAGEPRAVPRKSLARRRPGSPTPARGAKRPMRANPPVQLIRWCTGIFSMCQSPVFGS